MVFLPVCIFQFTHPRTFSPYIFNAKTLTQQLNTLPANIPFFVYPPHLSSLILIINAALPFPFNPLSSALIQPDTYHQIAINS